MKKNLLTLLVVLALMSSCKDKVKTENDNSSSISEATLYFGGDIITMEGEAPQYVEAVVRKGDYIVFVGSLDEAKKQFKDAL